MVEVKDGLTATKADLEEKNRGEVSPIEDGTIH